jgi:hypothetical protein
LNRKLIIRLDRCVIENRDWTTYLRLLDSEDEEYVFALYPAEVELLIRYLTGALHRLDRGIDRSAVVVDWGDAIYDDFDKND